MNCDLMIKEKSFTITADVAEYRSLSNILDKLDSSLYTVDMSCDDFPSISFFIYCGGIRDEADVKAIYDYIKFALELSDSASETKILIKKAKETFNPDDVEKALDACKHDSSELLRIGRAIRAFEKRAKESRGKI